MKYLHRMKSVFFSQTIDFRSTKMKISRSLGRRPLIGGGLLLLLVTLHWQCEDPDRPLTRAERNLIDSFYRKELIVLQGQLDSLCEVKHDSIFRSKFDSILQKREAERKETMGKYHSKYQ